MGNIHYISDLHFGHKMMAEKRGFSSVQEHDEHIIRSWNSVITKRDTVWILGDITMEKDHYEILDRLNGFKKVVLGNHDKPQHVRKLLQYVNSVCGVYKHDRKYWLTHIPMHPTELRGKINIHGHVHENSIQDDRYINVSCEVINYKPIRL